MGVGVEVEYWVTFSAHPTHCKGGRRKETQQQWECYGSDGKASSQSGAKESHKLTLHNKTHTIHRERKNSRGWLPLL